jgi:SAM-dependent methyltransferase
MQQGDFTALAKDYINRTGYSLRVLKHLAAYLGAHQESFVVADVGAGTGKLTEGLIQLGLRGYAVEPNHAMRAEGLRLNDGRGFVWREGAGETTTLADSSVDWLLMASSFHWTDPQRSLPEFHRVLKPGGYFTALWNPRNLEQSQLHLKIEARIHEMVPNVKRVSSGSRRYTEGIEDTLVLGGWFDNLIFIEAAHEQRMSRERYLGAWRSVNDIQAQAGAERFKSIMRMIEEHLGELQEIVVPYRTRAWTVQSTKGRPAA